MLLQEAFKGKIDETVKSRTFKVGIGSPVEYWFNNQLKEWVLDSVKNQKDKTMIKEAYQSGGLSNQQVKDNWMKMNLKMIS